MVLFCAWIRYLLCEDVYWEKSKLLCRYLICMPVHALYWIVGLLLSYLTTIIMFSVPSLSILITPSSDLHSILYLFCFFSVIGFLSCTTCLHIPLVIFDGLCISDTDWCCSRKGAIYYLTVYIFFIIFSNIYTYIFLIYVTRNTFFVICLPFFTAMPTAFLISSVYFYWLGLKACWGCMKECWGSMTECIGESYAEFENNHWNRGELHIQHVSDAIQVELDPSPQHVNDAIKVDLDPPPQEV
jgi:hypothetical protein